MPQNINGSPMDIMKAISMFDIEEDFDDTEARKKLDMLFHELIMSNDPKAKEYIGKFLDSSENIIADMGVIEKPEDDEEDVEFPEEEPTDDIEEEPSEEEPSEEEPTEEPPQDETETDGEEEVDEIPDELLSHYNPLIDRANSFIYM